MNNFVSNEKTIKISKLIAVRKINEEQEETRGKHAKTKAKVETFWDTKNLKQKREIWKRIKQQEKAEKLSQKAGRKIFSASVHEDPPFADYMNKMTKLTEESKEKSRAVSRGTDSLYEGAVDHLLNRWNEIKSFIPSDIKTGHYRADNSLFDKQKIKFNVLPSSSSQQISQSSTKSFDLIVNTVKKQNFNL
jgi:hypothetical protein